MPVSGLSSNRRPMAGPSAAASSRRWYPRGRSPVAEDVTRSRARERARSPPARGRWRPPGRRCRPPSRSRGSRPSRAERGRSPSSSRPRNSVGPAATPVAKAVTPAPENTWKSEPTTAIRASMPRGRTASRRPGPRAAAPRSLQPRIGRGVSSRRVARPAAAATGLPLNVPPWLTAPGPSRVEDRHDVGPAAERRERVAAPDDLAERRQVRPDAEALLRAAGRDPERDDLVEDQQRAGSGRRGRAGRAGTTAPARGRRRRPGRARR